MSSSPPVSTAVSTSTVKRGKTAMPELKRKFKLGELLLTAGKITQEQLDGALQRSKDSGAMLGETLVDMGLIKPMELLNVVGQQIGLPAVELRTGLIDPDVAKFIPKEKAQYYGVIPMFHVEDRLTVGISRPLSIFEYDDLERISDCSIQLVLCGAEAVQASIEKYYGSDVNIDGLLSSIEKSKV